MWRAAVHDPLRKLDDRIWVVDGPIPGLRMPLPRTMTLVKRADGSLLVHSAIALSEDAMREVEAWGTPRVLVVPNGWHRIDAPAWKARFPDLEVRCPRSQTKRVGEVVHVDGAMEELAADGVVRAEVFDGLDKESVLVVDDGGRVTLVFGDTFMNAPHQPGVPGFFYRLAGASGGARVHPFMKWMSKKRRLSEHLARLADLPGLARLIPGHGAPIDERPADVLRDAVRDA